MLYTNAGSRRNPFHVLSVFEQSEKRQDWIKIVFIQLSSSSPFSPDPSSHSNPNPTQSPISHLPPTKNCHQPFGGIGYPEIEEKERKRRGRMAEFRVSAGLYLFLHQEMCGDFCRKQLQIGKIPGKKQHIKLMSDFRIIHKNVATKSDAILTAI